jgi:hypothetical protein
MKIGVKLVGIISALNIIGLGLLACITVNVSQKEISRMNTWLRVNLPLLKGAL